MKFAIIFFALFSAAYACTCAELPTFRKAVLDAKKTKAPFAVVTVVAENRPNDPFGFKDVVYTVRPQGCKKTIKLITKGTGSLCGVRLQLNTQYVVNLNKDRTPTPINSCQSFRLYSSLSAADKVFVALNVPSRCGKCRKKCPRNKICIKGRCRSIPTCKKLCPTGQICQFGGCVPKCLTTICSPGFVCRNGKCIKKTVSFPCTRSPCRPGFVCKAGRCVRKPNPISGECKPSCKPGFFCLAGTCTNECNITRCSIGTICRQTSTGVECVKPTEENPPSGKCEPSCPAGKICLLGTCVIRPRQPSQPGPKL